jgi:hypothetical protein
MSAWQHERSFDAGDIGETFAFYCSLHGTAGGAGRAGTVTVE